MIRRFKVNATFGHKLHWADGIEWDGKLWLVIEWTDIPDLNLTRPARMIRIDQLAPRRLYRESDREYVLERSLPESLLHGGTAEGVECLSGSQIRDVFLPLKHQLH